VAIWKLPPVIVAGCELNGVWSTTARQTPPSLAFPSARPTNVPSVDVAETSAPVTWKLAYAGAAPYGGGSAAVQTATATTSRIRDKHLMALLLDAVLVGIQVCPGMVKSRRGPERAGASGGRSSIDGCAPVRIASSACRSSTS
jgi:hypothetical protein